MTLITILLAAIVMLLCLILTALNGACHLLGEIAEASSAERSGRRRQ